jgi:hypothetical protein
MLAATRRANTQASTSEFGAYGVLHQVWSAANSSSLMLRG